jgi:hypothetical protein
MQQTLTESYSKKLKLEATLSWALNITNSTAYMIIKTVSHLQQLKMNSNTLSTFWNPCMKNLAKQHSPVVLYIICIRSNWKQSRTPHATSYIKVGNCEFSMLHLLVQKQPLVANNNIKFFTLINGRLSMQLLTFPTHLMKPLISNAQRTILLFQWSYLLFTALGMKLKTKEIALVFNINILKELRAHFQDIKLTRNP